GPDPAPPPAVAEPDARRPRAFDEHVREAAAIDLPGRRRQQLADADLGAAVDVASAVGKEEAEAELADLLPVEVLAQPQHVGKVVGADLDRGFADLERGLRRRVHAPFKHGDRERGVGLAQLQRQGQAGQAAAEDRDVEAIVFVHQHWPSPVRALPSSAWLGVDVPLPSSMTGGRLRVRAYPPRTSPCRRTWPTTCEVIAHRSRPRRKWLLRNSTPGSQPA